MSFIIIVLLLAAQYSAWYWKSDHRTTIFITQHLKCRIISFNVINLKLVLRELVFDETCIKTSNIEYNDIQYKAGRTINRKNN